VNLNLLDEFERALATFKTNLINLKSAQVHIFVLIFCLLFHQGKSEGRKIV